MGGYTIGVNLHGAPYDWRLAPDGHAAPGQYYDKLKALIESSVTNNGRKAVIVTHSLGGPTINGFFHIMGTEWVKAHVQSFVPISGPFGGAAEMTLSEVSGDNFGVPFLPMDYLKPVQTSAASGVFLLPDPASFGASPIVQTSSGQKYAAKDMLDLLRELDLTQAADIMESLQSKGLMSTQLPPPPVQTFVITSTGVKTGLQYEFPGAFNGKAYDQKPQHTTFGDGDGTVNEESLQYPAKYWAGKTPMQFLSVDNVSHFGMVKDEKVLDYVLNTVLKRAQQVEASVVDTNDVTHPHHGGIGAAAGVGIAVGAVACLAAIGAVVYRNRRRAQYVTIQSDYAEIQ